MSLLKCLNSIVQGGHHLHLELEVLLRGQGWRHRYPGTLVVLALGCSAPAAGQNHAWCSPSDLNKRCMSKDIAEIILDGYDIFLQGRLRHDKVDRIECMVLTSTF